MKYDEIKNKIKNLIIIIKSNNIKKIKIYNIDLFFLYLNNSNIFPNILSNKILKNIDNTNNNNNNCNCKYCNRKAIYINSENEKICWNHCQTL
jgi:hypothetical protein